MPPKEKNSGNKKRKAKTQAEKAADAVASNQHELHIEFDGLLRTILARGTSFWKNDSLRYLRNFCHAVRSRPDTFPMMMGDSNGELMANSNTNDEDGTTEAAQLTKGYIASFAAGGDTSLIASSPILHVLDRRTNYQDVTHADYKSVKTHQKVKLTILRLLDGDLNEIHARMATHIADAGRVLQEGDMIKLNLFTELTYHVNAESPAMPALFIVGFTWVGEKPVPLPNDLKGMIPYKGPIADDLGETTLPHRKIDPLTQEPPVCTYENRLCRKFGVNFIGRCICEEIPVGDRDLNVIAEDCHLINKPAKEITENKPKRLMLYWWYATNIYSLTGKGHRGKLPDCLEYAIKAAYPETDSSEWVGYKEE